MGALAAAGCTPGEQLTGALVPQGPGSILLSVHGLPSGAAATISISSAQGYQRSATGSATLSSLPAGSYAVVAAEVSLGGDRYVPAPTTQNVTVTSGANTAVEVVYVLVTARLQLTLAGLPEGAAATLTLSGPAGYQRELTASGLLTGLVPGAYTLHSPSVAFAGERYQTAAEVQNVTIAAADTVPVAVAVAYALATGRMVVDVSGVPAGSAAAIQVVGQGLERLITGSDTLIGLVPGSYTLSAASVTSGGYSYGALPAVQTLDVGASPTPVRAAVSYGLATGGLQVVATGLPAGSPANISVSGPAGYLQSVGGSQLLTGLPPGSYTVTAGNAVAGGLLYAPSPPTQSLSVPASLTPAVAAVSYTLASATLSVGVSGLPAGVPASLSISGPAGYSAHLTTSSNLSGLVPGDYVITAASIASGGVSYAPQPTQQSLALAPGGSQSATVAYAMVTGGLSLTVAGLPAGVPAIVSVSGPGGFVQVVTASQLLSGLVPGTYTLAASAFSNAGVSYTPTPSSQGVLVSGGANSSALVSYTVVPPPTTFDLRIDGLYLTQATQRYDGSVPLVAGRDALLRVFALANQANSATPQVRVRLYNGAALVQTYTIAAPAASVPQAPDESSLAGSWNVLVPGALVQPGLRVLADADPAGAVAESSESNNQFPSSGSPGTVDVRALPVFALRFVPVLQQVNGLQGNVSAANQDGYLGDLRKMLPVGATDIDVRAPYTTTAPALQSGNGNGAWNTILSELWALRVAESSSRYYYGVVKVSYGSGVAGLGYVGGSAHTAMGWDFLPSAVNVMAHEVGHNLSRQHAPCGGPSGPDPSYPYSGGQIGVWGLDVAALSLKAPATADLMGYCGPTWISDYNWTGMVTYRQSGPSNAPDAGVGAAAGLLVWGRITAQGIVLEPAFTVPWTAEHAPRPGPNRVELLAGDGTLLQSAGFDAPPLADQPDGERGFAFVLPLAAGGQAALAGVRVLAAGRTATRAMAAPGDPGASLTRLSARQVELRWDATRYPMVLVRDGATGQLLSFARGGNARLWATGTDFQLQFSDGVRSTARAARLLR